mgnify:CR=1 FL=1
MPAPSALLYIATAATAAFSAGVSPHDTGQPAWFGATAQLEKLYIDGGKVVATPMMNVAEATDKCPRGYVVRREGREERGAQTFIVWTLRCQ